MCESEFFWPVRALPRIYTAGRYPLADRHFTTRYQSLTHCVHLYDYESAMRHDGAERVVRPGHMTISPAGAVSAYDLPAPGQHWCVHFYVVQNRPAKAPPTLAGIPVHLSMEEDAPEMASRMAEIARLYGLANNAQLNQREIASAAASAALLELLLWLSLHRRAENSSAPRAERAVEKAAALLESRLLDPPTIPELSDLVELTQNYLARKFRQRFGMTIQRYILARRIEYARLLLASTDAPIARIAQRVGLPDPQHFNKQFRRITKMSPTQWRESRGREMQR